ncbi:hypothetical protein PR048_008063 [Dryococelus australis]|uniref:Uncharacterized protein n=1 Tax=Dryococelus australis TaxID=614101 RepID=A0ABQ9HW11_9NEOP|nr:hypothetical protein PR048_008063 [Dryococelus australis]
MSGNVLFPCYSHFKSKELVGAAVQETRAEINTWYKIGWPQRLYLMQNLPDDTGSNTQLHAQLIAYSLTGSVQRDGVQHSLFQLGSVASLWSTTVSPVKVPHSRTVPYTRIMSVYSANVYSTMLMGNAKARERGSRQDTVAGINPITPSLTPVEVSQHVNCFSLQHKHNLIHVFNFTADIIQMFSNDLAVDDTEVLLFPYPIKSPIEVSVLVDTLRKKKSLWPVLSQQGIRAKCFEFFQFLHLSIEKATCRCDKPVATRMLLVFNGIKFLRLSERMFWFITLASLGVTRGAGNLPDQATDNEETKSQQSIEIVYVYLAEVCVVSGVKVLLKQWFSKVVEVGPAAGPSGGAMVECQGRGEGRASGENSSENGNIRHLQQFQAGFTVSRPRTTMVGDRKVNRLVTVVYSTYDNEWKDFDPLNTEVFRADEDEGSSTRMQGRGETGNPRENAPTSGIVRRNPHVRKSGEPPRLESNLVCLEITVRNRIHTVVQGVLQHNVRPPYHRKPVIRIENIFQFSYGEFYGGQLRCNYETEILFILVSDWPYEKLFTAIVDSFFLRATGPIRNEQNSVGIILLARSVIGTGRAAPVWGTVSSGIDAVSSSTDRACCMFANTGAGAVRSSSPHQFFARPDESDTMESRNSLLFSGYDLVGFTHNDLAFHWLLLRFRRVGVVMSWSSGYCEWLTVMLNFNQIDVKAASCSVSGKRGKKLPIFPYMPHFRTLKEFRGCGGETVSLLASHHGEPSSIPSRNTPVCAHVGIVRDDAASWRVFSGISRFPRPFIPPLLHTHRNTLIGSQDLAVKSRPNFFAHSFKEFKYSADVTYKSVEYIYLIVAMIGRFIGCPIKCYVKKQGSDTGDTNTHFKCLIAPTRKACSVSVVKVSVTITPLTELSDSNTECNSQRNSLTKLQTLQNNEDAMPWDEYRDMLVSGWVSMLARRDAVEYAARAVGIRFRRERRDICGPFAPVKVSWSRRVKRGEYVAALECKIRGNGRSPKNPPTSGIVRHDSHMRKSGRNQALFA